MNWKTTSKSKHGVAKKTGCLHGHMHDSKRESVRCNILHVMQDAGRIHGLQIQPFFAFVINGETPKMANGRKMGVTLDFSYVEAGEPPRDCRRPFGLNYAAMGVSSSLA